LLLFLL